MKPLAATWVSCGVLRAELGELRRIGKIRGRQSFLESMLHMDPPRLEESLVSVLGGLGPESGPVVLVYGDCCSRMLDFAGQYRLSRVDAVNCAQMLVDRDHNLTLMRERAFMMLPEWAPRWEAIFKTELGLSEDNARALMGEHRGSLVFLDTGLAPVPREELSACADYTGLPWRVERVALDNLLSLLSEALASAPRPLAAQGRR